MENKKILIGCTGSVATIKIGEIIDKLLNDTTFKFEVKSKSNVFTSTNRCKIRKIKFLKLKISDQSNNNE